MLKRYMQAQTSGIPFEELSDKAAMLVSVNNIPHYCSRDNVALGCEFMNDNLKDAYSKGQEVSLSHFNSQEKRRPPCSLVHTSCSHSNLFDDTKPTAASHESCFLLLAKDGSFNLPTNYCECTLAAVLDWHWIDETQLC